MCFKKNKRTCIAFKLAQVLAALSTREEVFPHNHKSNNPIIFYELFKL